MKIKQIENEHTVDTKAKGLPYSFDFLYDIKTQQQLQEEVDYLAHRLGGIAKLCREYGYSVDAYVTLVLSFPNERKVKE